jgi:hypothetical protein
MVNWVSSEFTSILLRSRIAGQNEAYEYVEAFSILQLPVGSWLKLALQSLVVSRS